MEIGGSSESSLWAAVLDRAVARRRRVRRLARALAEPQGADLSERDRALLIGILAKLEARVRADLRAAAAKALERAGHAVPPSLAGNDAAAAQPLRADPALFGLEPLVERALHRSRRHQVSEGLRAASGSPQDGDTIKALLVSATPSVVEATKAYLVDEARAVDSYQDPLLRPSDLSGEQRQTLLWRAAARLRLDWTDGESLEPTLLDQALETAVRRLAGAGDTEAKARPAMALAERLQAEGAIDPALMIEFLRAGEVTLFEAVFEAKAALDPQLVQRLVYDPNLTDFALACRAIDVTPKFILALCDLLGGPAPDPLPDPGASRILDYWRRDPAYRDALEDAALGRTDTPGD